MVEKIVHLQICYIWLIKDKKEKKLAMIAMEYALSQASLYGGAIVLTHDTNLSKINANLPSK